MHTLSPDYFHSEDYQRYSSEFLRTSEAADYLNVSAKFLETARHRGDGPPYVRIGRSVRYMRFDLDMFMRVHKSSQLVDKRQPQTLASPSCGIGPSSDKQNANGRF